MLEKLIKDSRALERAIAGEELSYNDGLELMQYDNLFMMGAAADWVRQKYVGDTVTLQPHTILIIQTCVLQAAKCVPFTEKEMKAMHTP